MATKIPTKDAGKLAAECKEFTTHGNLWGTWHRPSRYTIAGIEAGGPRPDKHYVVYSYGPHHPLAIYTGEQWYVNTDKVSRTTSKHLTAIRRYLPGAVTELETAAMRLIDDLGLAGYVRYRFERERTASAIDAYHLTGMPVS